MPAIAQALELPEELGETPVATLGKHVGDSLPLLDNLEQLVPAAARYSPTCSSTVAGLKVLATSRVRLNLRGEHEHAVRPLSEAAASSSSRHVPAR